MPCVISGRTHQATDISNTNQWKCRLISNRYHECIKIMMMLSMPNKTWRQTQQNQMQLMERGRGRERDKRKKTTHKE